MQAKTTGIILHSTKYKDTATILTVYTRQFGRVSYMVYGVNKKKSNNRSALIQPLSIVNLDVRHVPGREMHQIKEIQMEYQFTGIPFHPVKNAIGLFLAEILFKTLKQSEPDEEMFEFLENSIQQLDCCREGVQNFHLIFLHKLCHYLGFEPNTENSGKYFDLLNGIFMNEIPTHIHYLLPEATTQFLGLLNTGFTSMDGLVLSKEKRTELIKIMLEYYRLHLPEFHQVQSLAVLQSLFD